MPVNSVCKAFFNYRSVAILMVTIFSLASSFAEDIDRDLRTRQVNLMIRQIGHHLLLQAGDLTSRVLPVTEIENGTFRLRFESEFAFNHDSLMALSQSLLPKAQFPSGYTVTVHECMNTDIVYGFQLNNTSPDILACQGRRQPKGCYTIEITFPDLYTNAEPKKNIRQRKVGIKRPTDEPKSIKAEAQEAKPASRELKTTPFQNELPITTQPNQSYPMISLVFSGMLLLLGVTLLIGRLGKVLKPVPAENHQSKVEPDPELAPVGKFLFNVKGQCLLLENKTIRLTGKECRVLELLNENFGELIPRETLLQKVWINEGVITGRSLDMFVSKLRKKLSDDPELRIANVHGKGYKLEIVRPGH